MSADGKPSAFICIKDYEKIKENFSNIRYYTCRIANQLFGLYRGKSKCVRLT